MSDNNNDQKTYKILVWGDSIGRQCEVPWPDRLQHAMQVSFYCGTDVEVVNITECGLSGIWGQNYFEEKVKPENPDLEKPTVLSDDSACIGLCHYFLLRTDVWSPDCI